MVLIKFPILTGATMNSMIKDELLLLVGSNLKTVRKERLFYLFINILFHIVLFYFFSILLSVFNSFIISKSRYNFSYPLFLTSMHMLIHSILAYLIDFYCLQKQTEVEEEIIEQKADMKVADWLPFLVCGIAAGLDIGLSNYSLKIVSLSFYTMVKSSTPIFILLFSFIFGIEKPTRLLIGIIGMIGVGVFLTSWSETSFDVFGFFVVMMASFMAGLRWTSTHLLLKKSAVMKNEKNPVKTMKTISPIVCVTLLICCAVFEGFGNLAKSEFFASSEATVRSMGILWTGALLAFCLLFVEFRLISITSVVTLSISGILKEILTILVSIAVFGDVIGVVNIIGLIISITGIIMYNIVRYKKFIEKRRAGQEKTKRFVEKTPEEQ